MLRNSIFAFAALLSLCLDCLNAAESITPSHSRKFTRYDGCEFIPTKYADGDSFRVRIGADESVTAGKAAKEYVRQLLTGEAVHGFHAMGDGIFTHKPSHGDGAPSTYFHP